jgi:predicted lipoprotein with Yx(FWY)xxD motif
MKKILSLSALFAISLALLMATLGNGLVTGQAHAAKEGPSCNSFETRNNPVKDMGSFSDLYTFAEDCHSKGKNLDEHCAYGTNDEQLAKDFARPFIGEVCKKPNQ